MPFKAVVSRRCWWKLALKLPGMTIALCPLPCELSFAAIIRRFAASVSSMVAILSSAGSDTSMMPASQRPASSVSAALPQAFLLEEPSSRHLPQDRSFSRCRRHCQMIVQW